VELGLLYKNNGNQRLLDMLGAKPGALLDCGCGPGDNARMLSRTGWRVTGITIDPDEQVAARPYCDLTIRADLENGLPREIAGVHYDVVLMSHILEHLARPKTLLLDAFTNLQPNGILAVALPNVLHYRQRILLLRGKFEYTDTGILDRTHLRFYTVQTARELLETAGFAILEQEFEGGLPWRGLRHVVPASLRRRLDDAALRRWPGLFAWQSLLTARPNP